MVISNSELHRSIEFVHAYIFLGTFVIVSFSFELNITLCITCFIIQAPQVDNHDYSPEDK